MPLTTTMPISAATRVSARHTSAPYERVISAADDGDRGLLEERGIAQDEEDWRRIGDDGEQRGKVGIAGDQDPGAHSIGLLDEPEARLERRGLQCRRTGARKSGQGAQRLERRRMGAEWSAKGREQSLESDRTQAGDLGERQIGEALIVHLLVVHELPVAGDVRHIDRGRRFGRGLVLFDELPEGLLELLESRSCRARDRNRRLGFGRIHPRQAAHRRAGGRVW